VAVAGAVTEGLSPRDEADRREPITETSRTAEHLAGVLAGRPVPPESLTEESWERLLESAVRHDLAPVLYSRLNEHGIDVPAGIGQKLRQSYLASAARSMCQFNELGIILRALQAAGIPVIPLKGACLAEAVYGNIALRPMGDADLLVQSRDVRKAIDVLRLRGFAPEGAFDPVAEQTISHGVPMVRTGGLRVDLHWTLVGPRDCTRFGPKDLDEIWSRAKPGNVGGVSVLLLSPTDLLLHLCMHAAVGHRFSSIGLRSFLDMTLVVERYKEAIDWEEFAARANRWGTANGVCLALLLAQEWTGLVVSRATIDALKADPLNEGTVEWVRRKVFDGSPAETESEAVGLVSVGNLRGHLQLIRTAMRPFGISMASMLREPRGSWRSLRVYAGRLTGYLARCGQGLWHLVRRDKISMADARKEARLREYLGSR